MKAGHQVGCKHWVYGLDTAFGLYMILSGNQYLEMASKRKWPEARVDLFLRGRAGVI